jgi:ADP-heptose:LPS heptosyltransferase
MSECLHSEAAGGAIQPEQKMKTANVNSAPRVLVVRLGAIGDALRTLPAVRRLRLERPDAEIGWVVEQWVLPVLAGNPNVDRFHVLDRRELRAGPKRAAGEMFRLARELRGCGYEVSLDFQGRLKSGLVSRLSGAPLRVGYARGHSSEGNHLFNNVRVRLQDAWENRVLKSLHLLQFLGIDAAFDVNETGLHVAPEEQEKAKTWYEQRSRPALAACPGSSQLHAYNRWPPEQWVDLLGRLGREGIETVLFWGPAEAEWVQTIAEKVGTSATLAPPTTLAELVAKIGCFKAFIGSNTAAMHMAWLQGVPTVFLNGPDRVRTNAPLEPVPSRVLWREDLYDENRSRREQANVVSGISVDEAFDAVRGLLSTGRGSFV